jgi:ABC-type uncharacterized transport system ATPase subunit
MTTPAITIRNLTKRYHDTLAVDRLTLDIAAGTIFGFLGPNGAGKTTTIRMLLGLVAPTAGTAAILGRDILKERALIAPLLAFRQWPYLSHCMGRLQWCCPTRTCPTWLNAGRSAMQQPSPGSSRTLVALFRPC